MVRSSTSLTLPTFAGWTAARLVEVARSAA
jgi:hypothetical protein